MAKYDDLVKRLARLRPVDFVEWVCPQFSQIEKVSFEDREFELTYRRVDTLYKVKTKEVGEFFLHLEFQAALPPDLSIRLHEYSTRIRKDFKLPVKTVVVFLSSTQAIEDLEPVEKLFLGGELISEFRYTKIILSSEEWKTIIDKGIIALFPLISLTRIPSGEEHQALSKAAECIEQISDAQLRSELAAVLYLVGGYRYLDIVKQVIKEKLMQDLMESATYREMAQAEQRTGVIKSILKFLQARFGEVSEELKDKLTAVTNAEDLDRLLEKAALAQTLEDFSIGLNEMG